jgi:uncharacterized YigZ family protein
MPHFYYTIEKPATAEYKDKGSRFIAFAHPITSAEEFKKQLKWLKEAHPKAAHHCFAYRLGVEGNAFRSGDDGEPAGSAGKPILGQLDSKGVTNAAIIVVRYFGGTLLGVPGLIQAYKTVSSLALQLTPVVQKPVVRNYVLQFDYTQINEVMLLVKRFGCQEIKSEMQLFCHMELAIPKKEEENCLRLLQEMNGVEVYAQ